MKRETEADEDEDEQSEDPSEVIEKNTKYNEKIEDFENDDS